jgi:predicted glycogen debranching enzyme
LTFILFEELIDGMRLPSIVFTKDELSRFDSANKNEWLITNGLGSYASSTALNINNRKYHALLVAALRPPGERTVILSKIDEDIEVNGQTYQLGANDFQHTIYPNGYTLLKEFSISPFPTHTYSAGPVELTRTVFLSNEQNAVAALYAVKNQSDADATIRLYPLVSYRHYHEVINRQQKPLEMSETQKENADELTFQNPASTVVIRALDGKFVAKPVWIEGIFYREEANRGESSMDQSYQSGYFEFQVPKNSTVKFAVTAVVGDSSAEAWKDSDSLGATAEAVENSFSLELKRREALVENFYSTHKQVTANDGLSWLLQAASDFIVKGTSDRRFVIAGYQWFGSWGRDTFVSLPGLMLTTGRYDDARSVITDYMHYCKRGLVPNLIDDKTGEPLYNTVDGTLWYINSILQYLKYSGSFAFVQNVLWPMLKDIVENHKQGTINRIHVDPDGLLSHGPQLTWMDTVVDGVPFTPRAGKAVEVQALWYNTLRTMQLLAAKFAEKKLAEEYSGMAEHAKASFNEKFWNRERNCLYDVINDAGQVELSTRPNQLVACALDFSMVDKERANLVVDFVTSELLTPAGLRTLSPRDTRYKGHYEGDRSNRDRAYHNGSIWPWLTGPLTTAYLKAKGYGDTSVQHTKNNFIMPLFTTEVRRGGLGTINEICDGDPPHTPRGCIAQAWSVAEPLRAYIEDVLQVRPPYEKEIMQDFERALVS